MSDTVFTLKEISLHFLNQVIMADAEFQLNQKEAWRQLGNYDDLYAGFSKLSSLHLNEIDYSFEITPKTFSWWDKFKMLFQKKFKSGVAYYTLAKANEPTQSNLKIKITIKRESPGKYGSDITTTPETSLKSEEINVIGFSK